MTKTVNIKVGMTCSGCSGAVTRVLSRIEGMHFAVKRIYTLNHVLLKKISLKNQNFVPLYFFIGVKTVNTNLETKMVNVECEDIVQDGTLVDALKKWAGSSGKIVELVSA